MRNVVTALLALWIIAVFMILLIISSAHALWLVQGGNVVSVSTCVATEIVAAAPYENAAAAPYERACS